jgi:beta-glucanase (GH16 family)
MMKKKPFIALFLSCFILICSFAIADPPVGSNWELVWSDEFYSSETPIAPDSSNWGYENGYVRNKEEQYYTNSLQNAYCQNGYLNIEAHKHPPGTYPTGSEPGQDGSISSTSIRSMGKVSYKFGYFEIRARVDTQLGSWPAFWTLGNSGGWPNGGECDILEYYTGKFLFNVAWELYGSIQWDGEKVYLTSLPAGWLDDFHLWAMEWDTNQVKLYLDGALINTWNTSQDTGDGGFEGFQQPHYMLINQAIGGTSGGDTSGMVFPTTYEVDWVRIWQENSSTYCGDGTCSSPEDLCNCPDDCGTPPSTETVCDDGLDDDCDGNTDCDDTDCDGHLACMPPVCGDGYCAATEDQCNCPDDCGTPPIYETNCDDGIDEDCDGNTDCDDSDCDIYLECMGSDVTVANHSFEYVGGVPVGVKTMGVQPDDWSFGNGMPTGGGIEAPSSDGDVCVAVYNVDSVYQLTDHTIADGDQYTLKFDSYYLWASAGASYDSTFQGRLYYDNGGSRTEIDNVQSNLTTGGMWHLDYTLNTTIPSGHPSIGNKLGIELATISAGGGTGNSWLGYDNVRLTGLNTSGGYCGDGSCDSGEDQCNCPSDCGSPPSTETTCDDGIDEDCDGNTDCADADCNTDPVCIQPCGSGGPCGFSDLLDMARHWLTIYPSADYYDDGTGIVDYKDFGVLSKDWVH